MSELTPAEQQDLDFFEQVNQEELEQIKQELNQDLDFVWEEEIF
jgi:hypothetical protein